MRQRPSYSHPRDDITSILPAHPLSPHPCPHDANAHACYQHVHRRRINAGTKMTSLCYEKIRCRRMHARTMVSPCYQHIRSRRIHAHTMITSRLPAHALSPHPCRHNDEDSPNRGGARQHSEQMLLLFTRLSLKTMCGT